MLAAIDGIADLGITAGCRVDLVDGVFRNRVLDHDVVTGQGPGVLEDQGVDDILARDDLGCRYPLDGLLAGFIRGDAFNLGHGCQLDGAGVLVGPCCRG